MTALFSVSFKIWTLVSAFVLLKSSLAKIQLGHMFAHKVYKTI